MAYKCRDCGSKVKALHKQTSSCPQCGSMYLLAEKFTIDIKKKHFEVTIEDRLLSFVFGFFAGSVTIFIWGLIGMSMGFTRGGVWVIYLGFNYSLYFAIGLGLIGSFLGSEKLIHLFGILWSTDKDFSRDIDERIFGAFKNIPTKLVYTLLSILIVGLIVNIVYFHEAVKIQSADIQ